MVILGTSRVVLRVGPVTLRLSGGCTVEVSTVVVALDEVVPGGP